jgi:predicted RNA-binding Zn-ribbon protein involved in translation (DUF1610 family)
MTRPSGTSPAGTSPASTGAAAAPPFTTGPSSARGPSFATERAVPFYCPYCGEEDLEPQEQDGEWRCRSCIRTFRLRFAGTGVIL